MKFFLLVVLSFLFFGCVGIGPVNTQISTSDIKQSNASTGKYCPSQQSGQLEYCKKDDKLVLSPEQFHKLWGEPKASGVKDGKLYLTYNHDIAWRGLVVFAIIPIPLLIPVGHNDVTLYFENEKLVRITEEFGYGSFAICGLHSEGPNGFGCVIWH